ncbi:MAG: hypothetical protein HW395_715 [candidate division NC10 bacterium]|nr:hypothetical protein [candidate division NC10 bacterium]
MIELTLDGVQPFLFRLPRGSSNGRNAPSEIENAPTVI